MPDIKTNPYTRAELSPPVDEQWGLLREATDALRALNENLLTRKVDAGVVKALTTTLREQVDLLAQGEKAEGRNVHTTIGIDDPMSDVAVIDYEISPLSGHCNAIAPPMRVWLEGDRVRATATMGWRYEGPPGCVHGGFVAAMFDQLLGLGQSLTDVPGVTGTLSIRYLNKTPLNTELCMEGWVERVEGRKNILHGKMTANGKVTATSEAVFIRIDQGKWDLA